MTAQTITTEIQKLSPSAVIELFVMDLTLFNEGVVRFHAGTNELRRQVVWQGNTYEPFPIQAEGFEFNGNGQVLAGNAAPGASHPLCVPCQQLTAGFP